MKKVWDVIPASYNTQKLILGGLQNKWKRQNDKAFKDNKAYVHGIGVGKEFFDKTQKAQTTEEKTDKLDCVKIKNCSSKDAMKSEKTYPGWEKI